MGVTMAKVSNNPAVTATKAEEVPVAQSIAKVEPKYQSVQDRVSQLQKMTKEDVVELTKILDDISKMFNSQLSFKVHEGSERLYVQFVDRNTGEVIKQLPPEELLELSAEIQKMVGLILDKYV